jgi:peptidoglycan/LPS O-acetylase OafA/YrhL
MALVVSRWRRAATAAGTVGQQEYRRTPMSQSPELIWFSILCTYLLAVGLVSLVKHTRNRRALLALLAWLLSVLLVFPAATMERNPGPTFIETFLTATPLVFAMIFAMTLGCEVLIRSIARRVVERATRSMPIAAKTILANTGQPQSPPSADQPPAGRGVGRA